MAFAQPSNLFQIAEVKPIACDQRQRRNMETQLLRTPKCTQEEPLVFEQLFGESTLNETNFVNGLFGNDNNVMRTVPSISSNNVYSPAVSSSNDHWITVLKAPTEALCSSVTSKAYHYSHPSTPYLPFSNDEHSSITTRVFSNRRNLINEPLINSANTYLWNSQKQDSLANSNQRSSDLKLEDVHQEILQIKRQLGLSNNEENVRSSPTPANVSLEEFQKLEQKLGATEFELETLKQTLKDSTDKNHSENKQLTSKIHKYKDLVTQMKTKYNTLEEENKALLKKVESFENYLTDLPTKEEMLVMKEKLEASQDDKMLLESQLAEEHKNLKEWKEKLKEKDIKIENYINEKEDLQSQITNLKEEIKVYELKKQLRSSAEAQDIDEILWQNDKLKREINTARKLLECKQQRFDSILKSHDDEKTQLEQKLQSERNTIASLQKEFKHREKKLLALKNAIKELTKKNQDLLDSNLHSRQRLLDAAQDDHSRSENIRLENKLCKQLQLCFHEIKNLVNVIQVQLEGGDPNISMMLGPSNAVLLEKQNFPVDDKHLKERLQDLRNLRKDIECLRNKLSSKYAENLAHNLTCNTQ